ncbi:phosphatidylserine/phosphatidylglycerophosphate/cardiolipin synthase family protein [Aurantimonas sp. 22II-16-19i]|uniref:phospholipase D-like domain-containing protein n=1 Tax=Aurantimonas sp. 22II-16-19i TaxID=1317114 RepID=UPI0009F7E715|nr:phosphatidylserine/phosphatidylglycerophosphate/cardiolipin synthase family protein [Aurantimonas sp. 22II-16-19i]ORE97585.1 phospholipase D/transphosphatidylase [Aurantimonas sp. 22II-16-19i]
MVAEAEGFFQTVPVSRTIGSKEIIREFDSVIEHRANGSAAQGAAVTAVDHPWELFHSNEENWNATLELCDAARRSISIEQYIFAQTGIGSRLLRLLAAKSREGVRVRVLVDAFGSCGLADSPDGARLRRAGGEIVSYNSLSALRRRPISGLHRLHRKTVLCDEKHLMVGGSCFHDRMADWRDTMVRVEGPVVAAAASAFERTWAFAGGRADRKEPSAQGPQNPTADWRYVLSEPVRPSRQDIYRELLTRITEARTSVFLTTPYLFPDRTFWRAMCRLLRRGAELRLLLPARSDHAWVDVVSHAFGRALARRGAEIWLYEPTMIHAKLAIVDGAWGMISSFNLDILSFGMNVENGIVSDRPAFIAAMKEQIDRDLSHSRRL